jgi:protein-S-isoprenylcysteine O-methyltransferase Ste14
MSEPETGCGRIKQLRRKIAVRIILLPVFLFLLVLLPAGTLNFWQVYLYSAVLAGPMFFVVIYFLKKDPGFLERRLKTKEKEPHQKKIVQSAAIIYMAGFIVPGLDRRFGWSDVSLFIVILADILVLLAYIFIFFVFRENIYASRVIEVEKEQKVISTGPYSIVRHPMYLGVIVMYLSTPVALGSFWGIIPFSILPAALVLRILNEEKVLTGQLPGYREYCGRVRYRLVPYLW